MFVPLDGCAKWSLLWLSLASMLFNFLSLALSLSLSLPFLQHLFFPPSSFFSFFHVDLSSFFSPALTPSSLLFFHSSSSRCFLFSSFSFTNVLILFLSGFPTPCTSPSSTSSPYHVERQSSGRSSNTPACGSRRVCPSTASILADDSSSRSFERRSASLSPSLSFSRFLFLAFSLLSISSYPCILLSFVPPLPHVHPEPRDPDFRSAIRTLLDLSSKWIQHVLVRHWRTVPPWHRCSCRLHSFSVANVAAGWHFDRLKNYEHTPVDRRLVHTEILVFCEYASPSQTTRTKLVSSLDRRPPKEPPLRSSLTVYGQRNDTPRLWNVHHRVCLGQRLVLFKAAFDAARSITSWRKLVRAEISRSARSSYHCAVRYRYFVSIAIFRMALECDNRRVGMCRVEIVTFLGLIVVM